MTSRDELIDRQMTALVPVIGAAAELDTLLRRPDAPIESVCEVGQRLANAAEEMLKARQMTLADRRAGVVLGTGTRQ